MSLDELRRRWEEALTHRGCCPQCHSARVWFNGVRQRTVSLLDGERTVFVDGVPVRRLRCGECGGRWSHEPAGVARRGHYQACVVARAVTQTVLDDARRAEIAHDHGCHRRTLGRWVERVAAIAEPAHLARILLAQSEVPVVPALPAPRPSRSGRLRALGARAVAVLALLEALASLRGLEPPALGHARWLVHADAPSTDRDRGARSMGERDGVRPR
jgi:transposase-like protein